MFINFKKILIYCLLFIASIVYAQEENIFTPQELQWIAKNPTITINMLNDYKPFSYIEENEHKGFSVDLLTRISQISGLKFDIKTSNWDIALKNFSQGKADMISEISLNDERKKFSLFTKPYYEIPVFIFGSKNNNYKNNNSLENKKIAITKDVFYKKTLQDLGLNIIEYQSSYEKAKAVRKGEADYFLDAYISGKSTIDENSFNLIALDEYSKLAKEDLRFAIHKSKPMLLSIISKTLNSIPSSELINLSNKWMINAQDTFSKTNIKFTKEEEDYLKSMPVITYSEINWHPLSIIENNTMQGIMGDYLSLVANRTGIVFQFVPSKSWPDVLEKFKEKKIDLVPGVGSSEEEKSLGLISKEYATYPMVIVTNQKYTYIENLSALKNKTIAVPKYYTSYNFIKQNYPDIKILATTDIPEALLKVKNGEADAFVGHIATSLFYISKLYLNDLKVAGTTDFNFEHHYLIQRENPLLLSIINKTFDSITPQEKQNIYSKWLQTTIMKETTNYIYLYIALIIIVILISFFTYRQKILKKYNKELAESYTTIEGILDATVEGIIIIKDNRCIDVNQSALDLFKIPTKEDALGRKIFDFIDDNSLALAKKNLLQDKSEPSEFTLKKSDNTLFVGMVKGTNLKLKENQIRVVSVVDLTEIKQNEKVYLEQAKLASLGEMIGNIAHQWRQPLSVITTSATGLKMQNEFQLLTDEKLNAHCDAINNNAQYLSKTIDDFRNFIKGDRRKILFNMKDTVESFLNLIQGSLKNHNITLVHDTQEDISIHGYPNELIQCFMNIFHNAKDALTSVQEEKYIFISSSMVKNSVTITMLDNAGGINEEIIDKIFEPYFTTKHKSQGTGLGLHMTYNLIVNGMNGTIKASNKEFQYNGKSYTGALFTIKLEDLA